MIEGLQNQVEILQELNQPERFALVLSKMENAYRDSLEPNSLKLADNLLTLSRLKENKDQSLNLQLESLSIYESNGVQDGRLGDLESNIGLSYYRLGQS